MSAKWPELGLVFEPEPVMRWSYPDDFEVARLRDLLRAQADWWSLRYEAVCAENRRLRGLLEIPASDL